MILEEEDEPEDGGGEEEGMDAVEDAAVAREHGAGVFDACKVQTVISMLLLLLHQLDLVYPLDEGIDREARRSWLGGHSTKVLRNAAAVLLIPSKATYPLSFLHSSCSAPEI